MAGRRCNGTKCAVLGCVNSGESVNKMVKYHRIPWGREEVRKKWLLFLRHTGTQSTITRSSRVCSAHFPEGERTANTVPCLVWKGIRAIIIYAICNTYICYMQYVTCYMLYAIRNMLYATRNMLYAIRNMLYDICKMLYAIRNMLYAICNMLYAIRNMLYAICKMLYAIRNMLYDIYATCYMQY